MSWFYLGDIVSRRRRKGVALRFRSLPDDVRALVESDLKKSSDPRKHESIEFCLIDGVLPDGRVRIESWARAPGDKHNRHAVVHHVLKENDEWVCEGDVGRGFRKVTTSPRARMAQATGRDAKLTDSDDATRSQL